MEKATLEVKFHKCAGEWCWVCHPELGREWERQVEKIILEIKFPKRRGLWCAIFHPIRNIQQAWEQLGLEMDKKEEEKERSAFLFWWLGFYFILGILVLALTR